MHLSPSSISPTESGERKRERERGVTIESCAKRSPCGLIVPSLGLDEARAGLIILLLDLNGTGQCGSRAHRLTSSQDWRCVQYAKVHPRTGVRTRRATGFWNRPLAGVSSAQMSQWEGWEGRDEVLFCIVAARANHSPGTVFYFLV